MDEAEAAGPGRRDPWGWIYLVLMVVIGSSTATAAKFAVRELPLGLLPVARFGLASLCLLPLVLRDGRFARMLQTDRARLLAAAALCVPVNQGFFLGGTRLAPTTHVGLIYAMCPLVVLALAAALGQERPEPGRVLRIVATVAGAVVVAAGPLLGRVPGHPGVLRGDLLLVGAVSSWGGYLTVNKPLVERYGALPALAGTFLLGAALDVPIALLTWPLWPPLGAVAASAWLGLAYLALVATVLGLACQNQALRRLDASQVATINNAAPLLTMLWGAWLLGEAITPSLLIGGALILGGIARAGRPARPAVAAAPRVTTADRAIASNSTRGAA